MNVLLKHKFLSSIRSTFLMLKRKILEKAIAFTKPLGCIRFLDLRFCEMKYNHSRSMFGKYKDKNKKKRKNELNLSPYFPRLITNCLATFQFFTNIENLKSSLMRI